MSLRSNILATLAYYYVLDMPLKTTEVVKFLIKFDHLGASHQIPAPSYPLVDLESIKKELDQLVLDSIVGRAGDYYFIFDREYLVPLRLKHEKIAKRKWQKARRAIRWLQLIPYVEAVFASGSLAINNTDELSDLDVLVVAKQGRIWLSRFLVTAVLSILGLCRRASDKIAPDKICLNHYISDGSLVIPFKSIYNAQTYSNLVPIYVRGDSLVERFKKANKWALDYVQNWNINPVEVKPQQAMFARIAEWLLEISGLGLFLNKAASQYQSRRISSNPATKQPGGRVVFNDEQLEFHPHSIEASIIKKYNSSLIKLGLPDLAIERDSGLTK